MRNYEDPPGVDAVLIATVQPTPKKEIHVSVVTSQRGTSVRLETRVLDNVGWRSTARFHVFSNEIEHTLQALMAARDALPSASFRLSPPLQGDR